MGNITHHILYELDTRNVKKPTSLREDRGFMPTRHSLVTSWKSNFGIFKVFSIWYLLLQSICRDMLWWKMTILMVMLLVSRSGTQETQYSWQQGYGPQILMTLETHPLIVTMSQASFYSYGNKHGQTRYEQPRYWWLWRPTLWLSQCHKLPFTHMDNKHGQKRYE